MKIVLLTTLSSLVENQRLAQEAKKMGHSFRLFDLTDLSLEINQNHLWATSLTNLKADLIIVRGIFSSVRLIAAIIGHWREKGQKVFDNHFLAHGYSIDKVTDLIKLNLAGVPVPDMAYTRNWQDYPRLAKKIDYPLVIKSIRMGKGAWVFKLDSQKKLAAFIDQRQEESQTAQNFILQEFIPYLYDLRVLIIGQHLFAMRRIPGPGEFRANFSLGGEVEPFSLDSEGQKLARLALGAIGMSVGGVDMLITRENKRYILEVNHTAGFVGMEKATGENIGKIYLEHAIEKAR